MGKNIALYIHIPFCKSKCLYCDFPSFCGMESYMLDYCKALLKELNGINEILSTQNAEITSIFIGGGTPTYLSLEGWKLIKSGIDKLRKASNLEFTVEGNPGTFEYEKLRFLKALGVNRLSMGLQAWQNDLLKAMGRIHTIEDFINSYKMAKEIGFENINVDLMFGLPNQTITQWEETLRNVIKLELDHISCYSLILEEGTLFMKMYDENKLILPSEEDERNMYDMAVRLLKEAGYTQYEISNFAKLNKECKHNIVYWSMEEYIGCGASAHSFLAGRRYSNERNVESYIKRINEEGTAIEEIHINSDKDNIEEFIFMGLRKLAGVSTIEFQNKFNRDINEVYGDVINKYVETGLLTVDNGQISLTSRGIPISNLVMSDFILN